MSITRQLSVDHFSWYVVLLPGGGHLAPGEQPEEVVPRELTEEFEIAVSELIPFVQHVESRGEFRGSYHSFVANLVTSVAEVKCNEGVRAEFFPPKIAVELSQHPVSRLFLRAYIERLKMAA